MPKPRALGRRLNTRRFTEPNIVTWPPPGHASANSSSGSITSNGSTRRWAICLPPSLSKMPGRFNEVASQHSVELGAPPPNPWDLSLSGQNGLWWRRPEPPPAIPAAESALGLRPRIALSSAQVLPEWITSTSPRNDFSSNGDYPLNFLSHSMGSPQMPFDSVPGHHQHYIVTSRPRARFPFFN